MKKLAAYGAGLIALYLGVYYYTGAGALIQDTTKGTSGVITAFQGRSNNATGGGKYPT
jgi:hypothetical protein